jgi:hypothetical protein
VLGDNPTLTVAKAIAPGGTADTSNIVVVGIADRNLSDFDLDPSAPAGGDPTQIPVGQFLNVVTNGSFKTINVDAGFGTITIGDKLTISTHAGFAKKLATGDTTPLIGVALDNLASGTGTVRVYLMLNSAAAIAATPAPTSSPTMTPSTSTTTATSTASAPSTDTSSTTSSSTTSSTAPTDSSLTVTQPSTQTDLPVSGTPPATTTSPTQTSTPDSTASPIGSPGGGS